METPEQAAARRYREIRSKFAGEFRVILTGLSIRVHDLTSNRKRLYSLEELKAETKRLQAEYDKYQEET